MNATPYEIIYQPWIPLHSLREWKKKEKTRGHFCVLSIQGAKQYKPSFFIHHRPPATEGRLSQGVVPKTQTARFSWFNPSGSKNLPFKPESTAKWVRHTLKVYRKISQKNQEVKSCHMLAWGEYVNAKRPKPCWCGGGGGRGGLSMPGALPGLINSNG